MPKNDVCPNCQGTGWVPLEEGEEEPCPLCNTLGPPQLPPDFESLLKPTEDDEED